MDRELGHLKAVLDIADSHKKKRLIELKQEHKTSTAGGLSKTDWAHKKYGEETDLEELAEINVRYNYLKGRIDSLDRVAQALREARISYSAVLKSRNGNEQHDKIPRT
jgi:hypothetical protein